mmetsp:Transcript_11038/g.27902  ORF Transcript_11038/g.27902 Transcript_11038/m.27902 type:complete len:206 (+) Transcript_11038:289-906(+)
MSPHSFKPSLTRMEDSILAFQLCTSIPESSCKMWPSSRYTCLCPLSSHCRRRASTRLWRLRMDTSPRSRLSRLCFSSKRDIFLSPNSIVISSSAAASSLGEHSGAWPALVPGSAINSSSSLPVLPLLLAAAAASLFLGSAVVCLSFPAASPPPGGTGSGICFSLESSAARRLRYTCLLFVPSNKALSSASADSNTRRIPSWSDRS